MDLLALAFFRSLPQEKHGFAHRDIWTLASSQSALEVDTGSFPLRVWTKIDLHRLVGAGWAFRNAILFCILYFLWIFNLA